MDLVGVPGAGAFRPDVEVLGPALPTSPVNSTRICVKWGMGVFQNVSELVGSTPLVKLNRIAGDQASVLLKLEFSNPACSVKDRIGVAMIDAAENSGRLQRGGTIVEATSGNTGIALAMVGASRGYRVILTMPDTMSRERRALLRAYGAELVLTPGSEGMQGAVQEAERIGRGSGAVLVRQFENQANPNMHYRTTGPEIWAATQGHVDVLVSAFGTGGTLSGTGRFLKERNLDLHIVAVEPAESPLLSSGRAGPHKIQGIGANFLPDTLDRSIIDEVLTISSAKAAQTARQLPREEGILGGISTGANVAAAVALASRPEWKGRTIVTFACDFGERYLSTPLFADLMDD